MAKLEIIRDGSCGACSYVVPRVRALAKAKGYKVSIVDVKKCGKKCKEMKYVPAFRLDGQMISVETLIRKLKP